MHIISVLLSLYFQFIHRDTVQKTIQRGKMKKIINILVAAICIFSLTLPVSAEEPKEIVQQKNMTLDTNQNKNTELYFDNFVYRTDTIKNGAKIKHIKTCDSETYHVYDPDTGTLTDIISIEYLPQTTIKQINPNAHTAFLTRDKIISSSSGKEIVRLRFTASVMLYSSGSFRSFEAVNYSNLAVASSISSAHLENTSTAAYSHTGSFPCTQLDYSFTCNVVLTVSQSASINAEIVSAGFSKNVNYYKYVYDSGSFTLY